MDYLHPYIPIAMILVLAAGFGVVNLFLSRLIGPRRYNPSKFIPYESGIVPTGEANVRIPIKFYMVTILFVLFDIEAVFVLAWAVVFRGQGLFEADGKTPILKIASRTLDFTQLRFQRFAFVEMLLFILILMVGYAYIWRKGGFKWS